MLNKQQISEIKQGIKMAVKQLILDGDKLFADSEKEIKSIDRKIATIQNKEKLYLTQIGYETTLRDNSLLSLNLQEKTIHNFIYSRNEGLIIDSLDINKIMNSN